MAVNDLVTAARYNNLQARAETILGSGANNEGYGQLLQSSSVLTNTLVQASDMNSLYTDMINARVHQTGTIPNSIGQLVANLDVITDDDDAPYNITSFRAFEELMIDIESDKFLLSPQQSTVQSGLSVTRTTSWNGTIQHDFNVVFGGYNLSDGSSVTPQDHIRHFFNSGGEIRISSNLSNTVGAKGSDWASMLSNTGIVSFDHTSTTPAGSGTGSLIGYFDLTPGFTTIFQKSGSSVYSENIYKVSAGSVEGSATINFRVEYNDFDTGDPNYDENVQGSLSNIIQVQRASGVHVDVPTPLFTTISYI